MELCPHLLPSMECILILSKNPILTKVFSQNNFLQNCCFSAQNYFFHLYNSIVSGFENFSEIFLLNLHSVWYSNVHFKRQSQSCTRKLSQSPWLFVKVDSKKSHRADKAK